MNMKTASENIAGSQRKIVFIFIQTVAGYGRNAAKQIPAII
jgi:hypothetical protein